MTGLAILCAILAPSADPLDLRDGDRVVWLGGTFIEREQRYGFWETVLTCRHPDKHITFRNLGWSGDTVWGDARAGFDTPREGFQRLVEQTLALKPTVIVLGYGTNEAFAGEAGLPRFREGLAKLLDALAPAKARVVLLAPLPRENALELALPDPSEYNRDLRRYREVLREAARQRGHVFVDLLELLARTPQGRARTPDGKRRPVELTYNGMHLDEAGYCRSSLAWTVGLEAKKLQTPIVLDGAGKPTRHALPFLPLSGPWRLREPFSQPDSLDPMVRARNLTPGVYRLYIDGKPQEFACDSGFFVAGTVIFHGPDHDQVEKLRAAIVEKNRLYFHRWRPQNETYLFGFRKYEQGKNAKEVAEFDALVAKAEAEIARLRIPVARTYELVAQRKDKP